MPVLLLRARVASPDATDADCALLAQLDGDLSDDAALTAAVAALRVHPVVAETRALAVAWAQDAVVELSGLAAGSPKDALVAFADALVDRAS